MRKLTAVGYAAVFVSAALYWLSYSMIRPVMSLYFSDEGYEAAVIGLFMALNSLLPIVLAMPVGSWIDRIGTRKAVMYGSLITLLSGAAFLIGGRFGIIGIVLLGQIINGIGGLLSWGALQASASQAAGRASDKLRGAQILSNFTFVNSLAQLAGPSVGGFLSDWGGYSLIFIVFACMNAIALAASALLPGDGSAGNDSVKAGARADASAEVVPRSRPGWMRVLGRSYASGYTLMRRNGAFATAIIMNGIMFMLVDLRTTFFPLYLDQLGLKHLVIGAVLSVSAFSTLLVRPFTGYAIRRMGHYRIMLSSMIAGGVSLVLLTFDPGIVVLSIVMFVWGASTGVNQPMAMIMVSEAVGPGERGMGMSIRTMSNRVVQLLNPLFFGTVTTVIGLSLGFGAVGLMLLGAGGIYRRQNRRSRSAADAVNEAEAPAYRASS